MKRLVAIAVVVAWLALPAGAQRGGGQHGGFSGTHAGGGFSAPRGGSSGFHSSPGGFAGSRGGFSAPRPPSFHGGSANFVRSGPPRFAGGPSRPRGFAPRPPSIRPPARFGGTSGPGRFAGPRQPVSHRVPYVDRGSQGRGFPPVRAISPGPRQPGSSFVSHRMPYHSPNGGDHRGSPNGGDHRGRDRDHGGRGWDHGRHHDRDRFVFFGLYGWGYPVWPWWGWGSPFLPSYWNSWDDYDSQPASNYAATQPYPEYSPGPYEAAPPQDSDPQQSEPAPTSTPWPYSQPAPSGYAGAPSAAGPEAPLTLVFKDGRPNQQIRNYLMTAKTLSVLDQQRRDIPVDQIDLAATAKVNRAAGVEFSIPGSGE